MLFEIPFFNVGSTSWDIGVFVMIAMYDRLCVVFGKSPLIGQFCM